MMGQRTLAFPTETSPMMGRRTMGRRMMGVAEVGVTNDDIVGSGALDNRCPDTMVMLYDVISDNELR